MRGSSKRESKKSAVSSPITSINSFADSTLDKAIGLYLPKAYAFIDNHKQEWQLSSGDVDLEVTNHVLRVRIQDGSIREYADEVLAVSACQNEDKGWGNSRDDAVSKVRSTAFCVQMLLRANRVLKNETVKASIISGIQFILDNQKENGSWEDPTWHFLDACSTSVGTLLFVVNEDFAEEKHKIALEKGMRFITSHRYENGLWYYKPTGSPVTITAHLLQKCATFEGPLAVHDQTIRELIQLQHKKGHWDNGNTDHTCDAIRAMMLTASRSNDPTIINEVYHASCLAIEWLLVVSNDIGGGLGDRQHEAAHVERTCDGIDAMLKLRQFVQDHEQMISFWS